jgi:hypothetical protein
MLLVILNICSKEELEDDELLSGPKSPGSELNESYNIIEQNEYSSTSTDSEITKIIERLAKI